MSILISALISSIKAAASFVPGINHRAIEFVCHYIGGTQTPMCLTEEETSATWWQVKNSIHLGYDEPGYGEYDHVTKRGWVPCPSGGWLSHQTRGIVGGFVYKTQWEEDEQGNPILVAYCHDEWDFNPPMCGNTYSERLYLPKEIPSAKLFAARSAARALGVRILSDEVGSYVVEADLQKFNEKHKFSTDWELWYKPSDLVCHLA